MLASTESVEVINRLTSQGYHKGLHEYHRVALLGLKLELSSVKEARVVADVTSDTYMMSDVRMTQEGINDMFRATPPEVFESVRAHSDDDRVKRSRNMTRNTTRQPDG